MDLEVAGSGPLAAVCSVPPRFMPYHAQFPTLCFKQDRSIITYNTTITQCINCGNTYLCQLNCLILITTQKIGWPAEHTHKKLMIHDNQISRELVPLCLAVHQKIAVAACSFNIQLCPCPCPWASSAKHILRARLTMKCTEVDKESHRDEQGSTQRSTRDDIEVARKHTKGDKGAHRGKQQCT